MNKVIRYLTLLAGWSMMLWVIILNYDGPENLIIQILIFIFWVMFPYYLYFFVSRKETNIFKLLLPALALNAVYLFSILDYFSSESSTAALVFLVIPIIGVAAMAVVYLIIFLVIKMTPKA